MSLGVVVLLTVLAACHRRQQEGGTEPAPSSWTMDEPFGVADQSMLDDEYVALGMASPEANWTSEDMQRAGERLRELTKSSPGALPRLRSTRSGKLFARITSARNLDVLTNPGAPIAIRLPAALVYTHALNGIYQLYAAALRNQLVSGDDLVELHGARLRACRVLMELVGEYLPSLSEADPSYDSKVNGIAAMRRGTTDAMLSALHALIDPRSYGLSARKRLLGYCREVMPHATPSLTVEERNDVVLELKEVAGNANLRPLQPELDQLRDAVREAVSEPSSPNAN